MTFIFQNFMLFLTFRSAKNFNFKKLFKTSFFLNFMLFFTFQVFSFIILLNPLIFHVHSLLSNFVTKGHQKYILCS